MTPLVRYWVDHVNDHEILQVLMFEPDKDPGMRAVAQYVRDLYGEKRFAITQTVIDAETDPDVRMLKNAAEFGKTLEGET